MSAGPPAEISTPIGRDVRARSASVSAPAALRARLAAGQAPARRRSGWEPALAAAAVAAIAVSVFGIAGVRGNAARPTAASAVSAALSAPARGTEAAGGLGRAAPAFPDYGPEWRRLGSASGQAAGRRLAVVTYGRGRRRVAYAIVAGAPLPWPGGAPRVTPGGAAVLAFRRDGALAVTWRRGGHTCLLASRDVPVAELLEFVDRPAAPGVRPSRMPASTG